MKTIRKIVIYLQMATLCLATAFADPELKEKDLSGSIQCIETFDIDFGTLIMLVDGSGTGQATHLGQFTYSYEFVADLSGIQAVGIGTAEFTATNGDSFSTEIYATSAVFGVIVENHTIIEGTGRFAGASGSFIMDRLITEAIGNINRSVATIEGTIVTPKSN